MLNIYPVTLQMAGDAAQIAASVALHDSDLARQLRRAAASVPLNVSEGAYSQGLNRRARYHSALGSARETLACAETALAMGCIARVQPEVLARMNQVIGALVNVLRRL